MERAVGNYMVANAVGQGVGPYIVGLAGGSASVPPTHFLFALSAGGAILTAACALIVRPGGPRNCRRSVRKPPPLRELLFIPGLTTIMLVSVVTVVAQDLIVVYLPLVGAERTISVDAVGTLLAIRAVASMVSRLLFTRLNAAFGRSRDRRQHLSSAPAPMRSLAVPLPLPVMFAAIALAGFALSISITASIAGVLGIASGGAVGTANSLRTMANRIGQFIIPFLASLIAAATGTAGIFVIIGISLAASRCRGPFRRQAGALTVPVVFLAARLRACCRRRRCGTSLPRWEFPLRHCRAWRQQTTKASVMSSADFDIGGKPDRRMGIGDGGRVGDKK